MNDSRSSAPAAVVRVLAVIDSLEQGGAERSLAETLVELNDRVRGTVVVFRRGGDGFEDTLLSGGFQLVEVASRSTVIRAWRIRRLARSTSADVVHASLWKADLASRLGLVLTSVPLVSSLVNETYSRARTETYSVRRKVAVRVIRLVDRVTSRRVDVFHAVTQSVADHHVTALGLDRARLRVVWRGRDAQVFVPVSPEGRQAAQRSLGVTPPVLIAIGRLEPQKRHGALIAAMPRILQQFPAATLVIAGREGSESHAIRTRIAELGVGSRVRLMGFRPDIPDLLAAADVFVLPSAYEGIAGSVIEALLCEVPVVASDLPGVREVTDDGRLATLIDGAGDAASIADAVVRALHAPATSDGLRREYAASRFSVPAAAAGLLSCYIDAIERRRAAPHSSAAAT